MLVLVTTIVEGADKLKYNKDIRPILSENCFACHGPDSAARKADLRLDKREDAIKFGAIVAGSAEKSPIIERIYSTEKDKVMPSPKSHKVLTAIQKERLKQWVVEGAEYELHWSFIAAKTYPAPNQNETWAKNPIDRFILAELEKKGLTPAPEADRRTLARRLSLDLNGIPQSPQLLKLLLQIPDPMPTKNSWISSCNLLRGANIGAESGSMLPALPIAMAFTSIISAKCGATAIG